ncbi:C3a anaphylatoxin chemotactic receptor-like [Spea bombifrons]|uniref:C3a anaphylatoxin chemotactic receptor-like n=1 Tax=Spea bombifrons TaxID=233779 RepID=UPI00234B3A1E|nr:C3a anaphylatoxin chemotactic receptor-like [Spea bombifrons]
METPAPFDYDSYNWTLRDYNYNDDSFYVSFSSFFYIYFSVQIICIVCYSLTFLVGITGNSLVIWIAGFRMKSVSSVWFLNLAITDLICNIALTVRIAEWALVLGGSFLGKGLCALAESFLFFNMLTSIFFLTTISIDRCVSIFWPLWSKIHRTPRLAKIISGALWLGSLVVSIWFRAAYSFDSYLPECFPRYMTTLLTLERKRVSSMLVFRLVFMFAGPFFIILVCNALIVYKLKNRKRSRSSLRPFKVITAVVVCFFICWFPYIVWPFVPLGGKHWKVDMLTTEISICLAYVNSCINPIIYVFFCQEFKDNFLKSLPEKLETIMSEKIDLNTGEVDDANAVPCMSMKGHDDAEAYAETLNTTRGV